jgi:NSS family neurotransmitter:Na+ symporter
MNNQNNFAGKIGAILATAGSAVGLGNIWRFPTEAGTNGGAAFLLIYISFMLLLATPIMIAEFTIGRHGQSDVMHAFESMSNGKKDWRYMGYLPVIAGILVLSYYAVVAGWTLEYAFRAGINDFIGKTQEEFTQDFLAFSSNPLRPLTWLFLILALTFGIVALGVQKGIERGAKIMMPTLFVFLAILAICSLTLPNASLGLNFLFKPDFSKVNSSTILSAMGQSFFTLSVGICCLCTYACYFRKDVNLIKDGFKVAAIDTLVAIMSGVIIFPAVYSIPGLSPDAGPSLVFITLPNVFQEVFSGLPVIAYLFSLMFYLLLVMAALTSSISMLEMSAAYFHKEKGMNRPKAALIMSLTCFVLGVACSLSFGIWQDITIFGMGFFDLFDFLVAKLLMPIGGLLICIYLGWIVDNKVVYDELTNNGTIAQPLYPYFRFIIRYFASICIAMIFITEIGLLKI